MFRKMEGLNLISNLRCYMTHFDTKHQLINLNHIKYPNRKLRGAEQLPNFMISLSIINGGE